METLGVLTMYKQTKSNKATSLFLFSHPTDPQHVNQPADGAPVRQQIELLPAAIVPATLELVRSRRHLLLVLLVGTTIVAVLPINCVFLVALRNSKTTILLRKIEQNKCSRL